MTGARTARRLLILTYSHARMGGIETWIGMLGDGLVAHGWHVTLASAWGSLHNDPRWREQDRGAVAFRRLDGRTGTQVGRILAVADAILADSPDVVIAVGLADAYAGVALARTRGWRGRFVGAVHAASAPHFEDLRRHASSLAAIGCVNATHAAVLRGYLGTAGPRIVVVPNGVPLAEQEPAVATPDPAGGLRVLYVGRLEQITKRVLDLPLILRAARQRGAAAEFTIVGSGPDDGPLRAALATAGLDATVHHLGAQPRARLPSVFARHDAILLCSTTEAAPLALLEGMAAGLAPVCSAFPGFRGTGYLHPEAGAETFHVGDTEAAADVLVRLARAPSLRAQRGRAAARVAEDFGEEACVRRWCALLESARGAALRPLGVAAEGGVASLPRGGRLDRFLFARGAERMRRTLRRFPVRADGWAEWPGTEAGPTQAGWNALKGDLELHDAWLNPNALQAPCECALDLPADPADPAAPALPADRGTPLPWRSRGSPRA